MAMFAKFLPSKTKCVKTVTFWSKFWVNLKKQLVVFYRPNCLTGITNSINYFVNRTERKCSERRHHGSNAGVFFRHGELVF